MRQLIERTSPDDISFLIKKYNDGRATSTLQSWPSRNLTLSAQRGPGLCFASLAPGKIVIVVGGTGVLPFSDLIDLLFKAQLMKEGNPQVIQYITQTNPILANRPFDAFSFDFMGSFNFLSDIHPVTLAQISYLQRASRGAFSFLLLITG